MTRILSQAEIDALLSAITHEEFKPITTIESFANYIMKRREEVENNSWVSQSINMFQGPHVHIDKKNIDQIFNTISIVEPQAIYKLGGVEFIPVNICPHCKNYHYDEEVQEIYYNAEPTEEFKIRNKKLNSVSMRRKWLTNNRTVTCKRCGKTFQPTIVISNTLDNLPYFCKLQLIYAIDEWFLQVRKSKIQLFSIKTKTIKFNKSKTTLFWDVFLHKSVDGMKSCPQTLMANIIKYTPLTDIERMMSSEKGIEVFQGFNFEEYYKPTQIFKEL